MELEEIDELVEEIIDADLEYEFVSKLAKKRKKLDGHNAIFDEIICFWAWAYPEDREDEIYDNNFNFTEKSIIEAEEAIKKLQDYVDNCKNYLSKNKKNVSKRETK